MRHHHQPSERVGRERVTESVRKGTETGELTIQQKAIPPRHPPGQHLRGATTKQARAQACSEFPELALGKRVVELILIARTNNGRVERKCSRP